MCGASGWCAGRCVTVSRGRYVGRCAWKVMDQAPYGPLRDVPGIPVDFICMPRHHHAYRYSPTELSHTHRSATAR